MEGQDVDAFGTAANGTLIGGRYALGDQIGEGGFAVTHGGYDVLLRRPVAVKMLRRQFALEPTQVARFRDEARVAAAVSHPNIVDVYDCGTHGDTFCIVMQYVPGGDLKHVINEAGRLAPPEAVAITRQVLRGLAAIHAAGIVHRDIKPQNVLLGDDRVARLTDFGVARGPASAALTTIGATIGTAAYMAPEQARGDDGCQAADLYAVGVVLFELLTGRLPFADDNPVAVMLAQVEQTPPSPRAVAPDAGISRGLEAAVRRALEKDPAARFGNAAEMERALAVAMDARPSRYDRANLIPFEHSRPTAAPGTDLTGPAIATSPLPAPNAVGPQPLARARHAATATGHQHARGFVWIVPALLVGAILVALLAVLAGSLFRANGGRDGPPRPTVAVAVPPRKTPPAGVVRAVATDRATAGTAGSAPTPQPVIVATAPPPTETPQPSPPPLPTETPAPTATPTAPPTIAALPTETPAPIVPDAPDSPPIQPVGASQRATEVAVGATLDRLDAGRQGGL